MNPKQVLRNIKLNNLKPLKLEEVDCCLDEIEEKILKQPIALHEQQIQRLMDMIVGNGQKIYRNMFIEKL